MKSRKIWFAVVLMAIYIGCMFAGYSKDIMEISPALLTIFGTYVAGNVGAKITSVK